MYVNFKIIKKNILPTKNIYCKIFPTHATKPMVFENKLEVDMHSLVKIILKLYL